MMLHSTDRALGGPQIIPSQAFSTSNADKQSESILGDLFLSNEVGLSLRLPQGAVVVSRQSQPNAFFLVRDGEPKPRWSLRLESLQSDDPTAEILIKRLILTQGQEKEIPNLEILKDGTFSTQETDGRDGAPANNTVLHHQREGRYGTR